MRQDTDPLLHPFLPPVSPSLILHHQPPLSVRHGEPGDGGAYPDGKPAAGCLLIHRPERQPRPAANRRGGRAERREELGAGKLRGQVSPVHCLSVCLSVSYSVVCLGQNPSRYWEV